MTYARKALVSLHDTAYYHVVARCVRRAWLWGRDDYAGRDYSYRKHWVIERLAQLTSVFTIDVCAYAVMSNHYHLVLYLDPARAGALTRAAVVARWTQLFSVPPLIQRWLNDQVCESEREAAEQLIERWRLRLYDLSWFMKCMNEHLARRANAEDECTGRFWEGRFRSQALLDEAGLLTAMAYVDLNPVRAGVAPTPEQSEFASIHERIKELKNGNSAAPVRWTSREPALVKLRAFGGLERHEKDSIPFALVDYVELLEWTGRVQREDKTGAINANLPHIMQRLHLDADAWRIVMRPRGNAFGRALGRLDSLRLHAQRLGQAWVRGLRTSERLFRLA